MSQNDELDNMHWMAQMLQTIEVGLVVIDKSQRIKLWNSFMENHSGIRNADAREQNLFNLFPELPQAWLQRKIDFVTELKSRAYSTWEQRPHLFNFSSFRPLTSKTSRMYQNVTLIPLQSPNGDVSQVCILVYDVSDIAINKLALEEANHQLEQLSQTDRLTGLYNRGHWEEVLRQEFTRQQRYQGHATLLMFDIDHFKAVNDTHGHQIGDDVIRKVASLTLSSIRQSDVAGRYGGEEFAVLMPDTDAKGCQVFAERLRQEVSEVSFVTPQGNTQVTISLGIAQFSGEDSTHADWIKRADEALYAAKKAGRNQTVSD